jgi:hypothetical protein
MDFCISAMFLVVVSFGTLSLFLCAYGGLKSTARPKSGKPVRLTDESKLSHEYLGKWCHYEMPGFVPVYSEEEPYLDVDGKWKYMKTTQEDGWDG